MKGSFETQQKNASLHPLLLEFIKTGSLKGLHTV